MSRLVLKKVPPYDGDYNLDLDAVPLTSREWGWVKRFAGYLPLTIDEGLAGGDPELLSVFAAIALRRAGRITPAQVPGVFEQLQDVPVDGTVRLELDEVEAGDADSPPARSSSSYTGSSGAGSPTGSETSANHQKATGVPSSAISASDLTTSVS